MISSIVIEMGGGCGVDVLELVGTGDQEIIFVDARKN
jgi:hypothetical protein